MDTIAQDVTPITEAKEKLRNRGFSREWSFSRGMLRLGSGLLSPRRVTVLKRMKVQNEQSGEELALYALRTHRGRKGFLIDPSGDFAECLKNLCR